MPDQQILASYRDFLWDVTEQSNYAVGSVWAVPADEDYASGDLKMGDETILHCVIDVSRPLNEYRARKILRYRLAAEKIRRAVDKFIEGLDKAEALSRD